MYRKNDEETLTKSARLRKYGSVYKKHIKNKHSPPKKKKKTRLNEYQKFVKQESQKTKYVNMKGSERLNAISKEWEIYKRKNKSSSSKINKKTY